MLAANFFLAQMAAAGFVLAGAASSAIAHCSEYLADRTSNSLLLPFLPLSGCIACFVVSMRARRWLRDATEAIVRGGHSKEVRDRIMVDILDSSGLQAMAAGGASSLALHFIALAAPGTYHIQSASYVYTYDMLLASIFGGGLSLTLFLRTLDTFRRA